MAHCPQCGAALQAGARYCAACGSAVAQPTLPAHAAPAPPAAVPARKDTSGAQTVILIGALLSALLPIAIGLGLLFFGAFFAALIPFWGAIPGAIFAFAALVVILGGLLFGGAGLWARNIVRDGDPEKGGVIAVVVGVVGCLFGNLLGGLVLLLGGIMAYSAK